MRESEPQFEERLRRFEADFGLTGLALSDLALALTHRSFAYENNLSEDNERLEFLGDAVIATITSEFLYELDSQADEGTLSKRRAHLVSRMMLGRRALEMGLDGLIRLGRGERETGGARRRSTLGSALEALVGIIYLRLGYEAARGFGRCHILEALFRLDGTELAEGDYKSALQEWAQQHLKTVPTYVRLGDEGPDHEKQFFVQVELAGQVLAQASGQRIKLAENEAARLALEKVRSGALELP